jgi:hypothetical protein
VKVLIIGSTSRLVPILLSIPGVTDVFYSVEPQNDQQPHALVMDNLDFMALETLLISIPNVPKIYVCSVRTGMVDERYNHIREKCRLHDIKLVQDMTDEQLQEELERCWFPLRFQEKLQPAIAIIGCHRRAGASGLALSLAKTIHELSPLHIACVDLDPYALRSQSLKGTHIWQLYQEYEAGVLTPSRIRELTLGSDEGLYHVGGNPKIDTARRYAPQMLEQLLKLIEQAFDLTVYAISPYWDNTLTLLPLKTIKRKYLVATSIAEEMDHFYLAMGQIEVHTHIKLSGCSYVYNFDGLDNESKVQISARLNAAAIMTLPYMPRTKTDNYDVWEPYMKAFAKTVVSDYSFPERHDTDRMPRSRSIWHRWVAKKS